MFVQCSVSVFIIVLHVLYFIVLTMCISYTADELRDIGKSIIKPTISADTWKVTRELHINSIKPTKRGHRAYKHKNKITKNFLKIGTLNAQSVRNKIDQIHNIIIEHDIDVLVITEHWLSNDTKDDLSIS